MIKDRKPIPHVFYRDNLKIYSEMKVNEINSLIKNVEIVLKTKAMG